MATEEQFQTLVSMVSYMTAKLEQFQEDVSSMKEDQKSMKSMKEDQKKLNDKLEELQEDVSSMKEDQKSMKEDQKKLNDKLEELQKDQKEIQGSLDLQKKLMKPLYTIKPVPEDIISVLTTDTFRNNVLELYKMRYCIVLSQLFPCQKPDHWFPAATQHIVIPTGVFVDDAVQLELHVADSHKNVWIRYRERDGWDNGQIKGLKRNARGTYSLCNLRFGDLDKKIITVRPKPYMRALYLKADMAHDPHPHDLPHLFQYWIATPMGDERRAVSAIASRKWIPRAVRP